VNSQAKRRLLGAALLALFVLGLGVFLAPFAFPTPPPIVTGFQSTRQFSPNGDRTRDIARIAVKLNAASFVDVEIRDTADRRWQGLIAEDRPKGIVRLAWDGTDDQGRPAPDGPYVVRLRARAGRKQWNASRKIVLDRTAPSIGSLAVESAALAGPGEGECRVAVTAVDRGSLTIEVVAPEHRGVAVARFGPKTVTAGQTALWNWDGKRADGSPAEPGLYIVHAVLADVPGNRSEQSTTCWAGHLLGATVPPRPALGAKVGVRLRDLAGNPIPPATRVQLEIVRRTGAGGSAPRLGAPVGSRVAGAAGSVRIQLPRRIPPARLWIVATTRGGRALIPLRP